MSGSTSGGTAGSNVAGCSQGSGGGLFALLPLMALLGRRRRGASVLALLALLLAPFGSASAEGTAPAAATPAVAPAAAPASALPALKAKRARARVLVLELSAGSNVSPDLVKAVSVQWTAAIARQLKEPVLSSQDVATVLGIERSRSLMTGCNDGSQCLVELGGAMGVDLVVAGSVARVGKSVLVDAQLLDQRTALVPRRFSRRLPDGSDDQLLDALEQGASELFPEVKAAAAAAPAPAAAPAAEAPPATASTATPATPTAIEPAAPGLPTGLLLGLIEGPTFAPTATSARFGNWLGLRLGYRPHSAVTLELRPLLVTKSPGGELAVTAHPFRFGPVTPTASLAGGLFAPTGLKVPFVRGALGATFAVAGPVGLDVELGATKLFGLDASLASVLLSGMVGLHVVL